MTLTTLQVLATSVDEALYEGCRKMMDSEAHHTDETDSRNGKCLKARRPWVTEYVRPLQRVSFDPDRNANPFFHLMEVVWMFAGSNEVKWLWQFNTNISNYSDDGVIFKGAYGHRWFKQFGNQVDATIEKLRADKGTRRAVIQMYDAAQDQDDDTKDVPCNLLCSFHFTGGKLNMTVFNRSNDMIWGAYGANAVHFSYLLEYVAARAEMKVGHYYQISSCMHIYEKHYVLARKMAQKALDPFGGTRSELPYKGQVFRFAKMAGSDLVTLPESCRLFMLNPTAPGIADDPWLANVCAPMFYAWQAYKNGDIVDGIRALEGAAIDWHIAGLQWLKRVNQKRLEAKLGPYAPTPTPTQGTLPGFPEQTPLPNGTPTPAGQQGSAQAAPGASTGPVASPVSAGAPPPLESTECGINVSVPPLRMESESPSFEDVFGEFDSMWPKINAIMDSNNVRRWHTEDPLPLPQTVGNHVANMLALLFLARSRPSLSLIQNIIYHDFHERFTGDIPAPGKWVFGQLSKEEKDAALLVGAATKIQPWHLDKQEREDLKALDMLEAYLFSGRQYGVYDFDTACLRLVPLLEQCDASPDIKRIIYASLHKQDMKAETNGN